MEGEGALTTINKTQAYVFDFDGTLGTIPVDWDRVREGLRRVTGSSSEFRPVFPTIGEVIARDPKLARPVFAVIDEFEAAAAPSARLYEGTVGLLARLSETAKVSLITMQGRSACSQILERFGLRQYLLRYFTREDSLDRAEQIEFALASMRARRASSMFVGDRINDLNAAKKVGVAFTMIRTHGEDPEDDVPVYHSIAEFSASIL
jgi:phosphoglycolate phosphatase-like HAD superfamily hydrolase